jgi:hypothetical protein
MLQPAHRLSARFWIFFRESKTRAVTISSKIARKRPSNRLVAGWLMPASAAASG